MRHATNRMSSIRTILVIDDEAAVRCSLKAILAERFNVIACDDGAQAIKFASEHSGEVYAAFVDYSMPAMDGNLVCSALRSLDATISLVGFSADENAPFREPLFAMLPKKNLSTEQVLTIAATGVRLAEQLKQDGRRMNKSMTE